LLLPRRLPYRSRKSSWSNAWRERILRASMGLRRWKSIRPNASSSLLNLWITSWVNLYYKHDPLKNTIVVTAVQGQMYLPSFEQITNTCKYKTWPCQEYNRFKIKYPILVLWKCKYSTTSLQYPISLKPVRKFGPAVEHYSLIQHIEQSEIGSHWLLLHVLANQREDKMWLVRQMAANMAQKAGDNRIWCLGKHLM
jgi:hypothetical protein